MMTRVDPIGFPKFRRSLLDQVDNGVHAPLAETDIDNFDRIMNINARGNLVCVRAQVAAMLKQEPKTWTSRNGTRDIGRGAIVNIASANSYVGLPGKGSYTISKHAFMAITKMACKFRYPHRPRIRRWEEYPGPAISFRNAIADGRKPWITAPRAFVSTPCVRPGCARRCWTKS